MDGPHDMGGMMGFGPINPEPEASEPLFHAPWESRVLALTLACGMLGKWNIDISRHARERQGALRYLSSSYYEIWMNGLEILLKESGLLSAEELRTGKALSPTTAKAPSADAVPGILAAGGPTLMESPLTPHFQIGDRVRVLNLHPSGHIRAPRYTRGRIGTVRAYNGVHIFADNNAHGVREGQPQYNVCFDAHELWGDDTTASAVHVDLWEPHLEPA